MEKEGGRLLLRRNAALAPRGRILQEIKSGHTHKTRKQKGGGGKIGGTTGGKEKEGGVCVLCVCVGGGRLRNSELVEGGYSVDRMRGIRHDMHGIRISATYAVCVWRACTRSLPAALLVHKSS